MSNRREFITLVGGATLAWPLPAYAQSPPGATAPPLVGFLNSASPDTYRFNADSFREGLEKAGFVEGRNIRIEERWANGDYQALPALAADLVAKGVVVIAATGDVASAQAAQSASRTVPVVFTIGGDPVRFGLTASFNRPGGHVTGISLLSNVLGAKRVELLHQIAPKVSRIALLMNPPIPIAPRSKRTHRQEQGRSASKLLCSMPAMPVRSTLHSRSFCAQGLTALSPRLILSSWTAASGSSRLRRNISCRLYITCANCGLLSYGPSISWMYRQAGAYVAQILKGANPAEMPVLQPTTFELVLNLKTAKALGLTVSQTLLATADEVIE